MTKEKHKKHKPKKNQAGFASRYHILLVFVSAFLLYANTLKHDYALDDDIYTKKNTFVQQGFSALGDIFGKGSLVGFNGVGDSQYRPVALLNFMAETSIFGLNPHVNHFFNILFYAITCLFVLLLMQKLFRNNHPLLPLVITLLYTFHPIHTEVVANIKSRDEILGFLFGIISLYYLMVYVEGKAGKYLVISVLSFFTACLSKENSLMFVFIFPLALHFFRELRPGYIFRTSLPFLGVVILYLLIRGGVLTNMAIQEKLIIMNNALEAATTAGERYATNFVMLGKYIVMLFYPHPLSWDYSYNQIPIVGFTDIKAIASLILYIALGVFAAWQFRKKNVHAFSILFYFLLLFLGSNLLIKIGATFGERFLYGPSLGFCISIAFLLFAVFRVKPNGGIPASLSAVMLVVLVLFTVKLVSRNKDWENNYTLFTSGLSTAPGSARVHNAMASEYRDRAEKSQHHNERMSLFRLSVEEYKKGIEIYKPDGEAYYNLGVSYFGMGDTANALQAYTQTLSLNKGYAMAMNNKGVIFFNRKQYDSSLFYFSEILKYDKSFIDAYANIGAVYQNTGQMEKAIAYYEDLIKKGLTNPTVYNNLSKIYGIKGDKQKSEYYARHAANPGLPPK